MRLSLFAPFLLATIIFVHSEAILIPAQEPAPSPRSIRMQQYAIQLEPGSPPRLRIERENEPIFVVPVVSGLDSDKQRERLSAVESTLRKTSEDAWELTATATSNLWTGRRFLWRFLPDHIEFQQFASGHGKLGRNYFLSSGVSNRWDNGTTENHLWDTTIYADRYFSPSPNHANQFEFNIAMPQILGFSSGRQPDSEDRLSPRTHYRHLRAASAVSGVPLEQCMGRRRHRRTARRIPVPRPRVHGLPLCRRLLLRGLHGLPRSRR